MEKKEEQDFIEFCLARAKLWKDIWSKDDSEFTRTNQLFLLRESECLVEKLTKLISLGFFTVSSQPTSAQSPHTVRPRQRANVVGYVAPKMKSYLTEELKENSLRF